MKTHAIVQNGANLSVVRTGGLLLLCTCLHSKAKIHNNTNNTKEEYLSNTYFTFVQSKTHRLIMKNIEK